MIIVIILIMNDNQGCDGSDRVGKVGPASLPSEEEESGKKEGGCGGFESCKDRYEDEWKEQR